MKYKVTARQTYEWGFEVEAENIEGAKIKARDYFENEEDGCTGVCDANSYKRTKIIVKR